MADTTEIIVAEIAPGGNPHNYHDLKCCDWTRGADNLFARYAQDRRYITDLITNGTPDLLMDNIWKADGPLAIDNECRCQMGKNDLRSSFSCAQCKNLRRLIDFRLGGSERPFSIQCGNNVGKSLIVSSADVSELFLADDLEAAKRARVYLQQYQALATCGTSDIASRYITGDSFTIRTLIQWMISNIFAAQNLPHCSQLYTSFVCNNIGYSLFDNPSIGSLKELSSVSTFTPALVRGIILQLLVILLELSKVNFSHGSPGENSLIFTKDPVSYLYDGVKVSAPVTVQISNLWNASATFNNIHYFSRNAIANFNLERSTFVPEIVTKKLAMAYCSNNIPTTSLACSSSSPVNTSCQKCSTPVNTSCQKCSTPVNTSCQKCSTPVKNGPPKSPCQKCSAPKNSPPTDKYRTFCPTSKTYDICQPRIVNIYRLTNSTVDIYMALRHIGFPLYVGSFDFYCFMVFLMCEESFYKTVVGDADLYRLWSMIWLKEDIAQIEVNIRELHQLKEVRVIDVIRGSWMRCDIVPYLWSLVKEAW